MFKTLVLPSESFPSDKVVTGTALVKMTEIVFCESASKTWQTFLGARPGGEYQSFWLFACSSSSQSPTSSNLEHGGSEWEGNGTYTIHSIVLVP